MNIFRVDNFVLDNQLLFLEEDNFILMTGTKLIRC